MPKKFIFSLSIFLISFTFLLFVRTDIAEALIIVTGRAFGEAPDFWDGCSPLLNVSLRFGGISYMANCNTGTFTFTNVTEQPAGTPMIIYYDDPGRPSGSIVIRYFGSGNVSGANIFQDTVTLRSDDGNPVTTGNMSLWDNNNDSAINFEVPPANITCNVPIYTIPANGLCVENNQTLSIPAGVIFSPVDNGGNPTNVMTPMLSVLGTYSGGSEILYLSGAGASLSISGNFITPTYVYYIAMGDVTVNAAVSYINLSLAPINTAADYTYTSLALSVSGNFIISNSSNIATVTTLRFNLGGNLTVGGAFNIGSGLTAGPNTVRVDTGTFNITTGTLNIGSNVDVQNRNFGILYAYNSNITINGNLFIDRKGTLSVTTPGIGSTLAHIYISGNWVNGRAGILPLWNNGTFVAGYGTVTFQGSGDSYIRGNNDFYNFEAKTVKRLFFQFDLTQGILSGGKLTINGNTWCSFVTLGCTITGAPNECGVGETWVLDLNPGSGYDIEFVDVSNSYSTSNIDAQNSRDSGENSPSWNFEAFTIQESYYNLSGYAWSPNIGYISFNSRNCDTNLDCLIDNPQCGTVGTSIPTYGVRLPYESDPNYPYLEGYAWAGGGEDADGNQLPTIGWIRFDPPDPTPPWSLPITVPHPEPPGFMAFNNSDPSFYQSSQIQGFIRACIAAPNSSIDCGGGVDAAPESGGSNPSSWAGWILMSGYWLDETLDLPNGEMEDFWVRKYTTLSELYGWAWGGGGTQATNDGSGVIGWISFNHRNCDNDGDGTMEVGEGLRRCSGNSSIICAVDDNCEFFGAGVCQAVNTGAGSRACSLKPERVCEDDSDCIGGFGTCIGCPLVGTINLPEYQVTYNPENQPPNPSTVSVISDFCAYGTSSVLFAQGTTVTIKWTFSDTYGNDTEDGWEVQIGSDSLFNDPIFKKQVVNPEVGYNSLSYTVNLAEDEDPPGDFVPAFGQNYLVRVRVKDDSLVNNGWSDWSLVPGNINMPAHAKPKISINRCPFRPEPLFPVQFCSIGEEGRCDPAPPPDPEPTDDPPGLFEPCDVSPETECYGSTCDTWLWYIEDAISETDDNIPVPAAPGNPPPVNSSSRNPANVIFQSSGTKDITLKVTDSTGLYCTKSTSIVLGLPLPTWIEIQPPNPP